MPFAACSQGQIEFDLVHDAGNNLLELRVLRFAGSVRPEIEIFRRSDGATQLTRQSLDAAKDMRGLGLMRNTERLAATKSLPNYGYRIGWP